MLLPNKTVICVYNTDMSYNQHFCNVSEVYISYKHKTICLTFFNEKNANSKVMSKCLELLFIVLRYKKTKVIYSST